MQSNRPQVAASPRSVFGKRARFLRRAGWVPANVSGGGERSVAVQLRLREIEHVLVHVPRSALLSLALDGDPPTTVLIKGVVRKPTTDELYHVDFYRVSMTERLRVKLPLVFTGESPASKLHGAMILHAMNSLEVESLPGDLPTRIVVDLERLVQIDDAVFVRDLALPRGVAAVVDGDELVAKALAPTVEEVVEEVPAPERAAEPPPEGSRAEHRDT